MDFEEFMIANQVSAATLDMLEEKWKASAPVIPLLASKSSNVFRLFSSDIGLLTSAYPAETKMELINKNGEVNNGAHFENVIAQQLTANGFTPYFCKKKNIGEMDFAIEMNGKVVPIEVKSGKAYRSHKALDHFMKVADYHLGESVCFFSWKCRGRRRHYISSNLYVLLVKGKADRTNDRRSGYDWLVRGSRQ